MRGPYGSFSFWCAQHGRTSAQTLHQAVPVMKTEVSGLPSETLTRFIWKGIFRRELGGRARQRVAELRLSLPKEYAWTPSNAKWNNGSCRKE